MPGGTETSRRCLSSASRPSSASRCLSSAEVPGRLERGLDHLLGEVQLGLGPAGVIPREDVVQLEALVGDAHRVGHAVVELAADPLPLGLLGQGHPFPGEQPLALLRGPPALGDVVED